MQKRLKSASKKFKQAESESGKKVKSMESGKRGFKCRKTLFNRCAMARRNLPESPNKFAQVVETICTPKKRKAIGQLSMSKKGPQKRRMDPMKIPPMKKSRMGPVADRILLEAKRFSTGSKYVPRKPVKTVRKSGKRVPSHWVKQVRTFYLNEEVSKPLPHLRFTAKHGPLIQDIQK